MTASWVSEMKALIPTLLLLLLAGCATTGPTAGLPDAEAYVLQTYVAYCGTCHGVPHPGRHRAAEWPAIVNLMERHMRTRGMIPPQQAERQAILAYLREHAR